MTTRSDETSPKDSTRSPWLVIVLLTIVVLAIGAFLLIRPGGHGASQTNPAAPATTQH